jgi:two-component system, OmpR family, copper resistance phosphate regulon response regulator CusR
MNNANLIPLIDNSMRILIVEDESKTAEYLHKGLCESGFMVDRAQDGHDGLFLATHHHYDLIILDIMLPKMDGFSFIMELRRIKSHVRVLFLTARDDVDDKVKGLELGADDYVVKPFSFSELLARIRSLLRRGLEVAQPSGNLYVADLKIDILKHKAMRGSQRLDLTQKEFMLLALLVQRSGEVLSRTFIAESVWEINFDSDTNIVDVAIRRLRRKVDDPFKKKLIHTVRGMGYLLEDR